MFFNRDLSWLKFNELVLLQAAKKELPLFERIKFLSIFSSNLDEFFHVRYPEVVAISKLDLKTIRKMIIPQQPGVVTRIQEMINKHLDIFGSILNKEILPELKSNGIYLYYNDKILKQHQEEIREIFYTEVLSFIQPIRLGSATAYNFIPENNKPYLIVSSRNKQEEVLRHDVVNIPVSKLKRFYALAPVDGTNYVIFIDDIIRLNIDRLFPGVVVEGVYSIKLNRDADINLNDEYSPDILDRVEKKLAKRNIAPPSRFLYEKGMPLNLRIFLAALFDVEPEDMFEGGKYHNLSNLMSLPSFGKSLNFPSLKPMVFPKEAVHGDVFNIMLRKDVLLHLPYHSYAPVLSFFNQAAVDMNVTEIYITLYRVAAESHIVNALISAARNGKKVTCFIELKARFDEANNIRWSRIMKDAGIKLIYSSPSIKVHSKIALVKRKEKGNTQLYGVVSTGNFNESTAKFYTDHVLLTTKPEVVQELKQLFAYLRRPGVYAQTTLKFEELLVARFNMNELLEFYIKQEMEKVRLGKSGLISMKVNNLEDPWMINLLYKASRAGVMVRLIVRSVCCLVPGVPGKSENITVKRIVDHYLEHSRLFIFGDDRNAVVYMGSADLMIRNLRNRIEVAVKIGNNNLKNDLKHYFNLQWSDNTNAVYIDKNLNNVPVANENEEKRNAQQEIMQYLSSKKS
jgi:polyphosphate kinase